jgi:hypothetical protein
MNVLLFITTVLFEMLTRTDLFVYCLNYLPFCNTHAESIASLRVGPEFAARTLISRNARFIASGGCRSQRNSSAFAIGDDQQIMPGSPAGSGIEVRRPRAPQPAPLSAWDN